MAVDFKKSLKGLAGAAAASLGVYRLVFRNEMVIVAFHRVNDFMPEDPLTCSSAKFDAFCRFFKRYFRVVSFCEQVRSCAAGIDMSGTLSITFDDGYRDNFELAAPILRKHELPATFFVATGFVGSDLRAAWDEHLPQHPGWMDWVQVKELSALGFDIGGHTVNHIDMGSAAPDVVRNELSVSKHILERELGRPVTLFAYPFGGVNNICERSIEIVKESGFISCASCYGGVNAGLADPYRLKRIGIAQWFASPHHFGFELMLGRV
jgi:peptidoglycan/xylan/chitin deacetylase (PgdA/CDA1 family)